MKRHNGRIIAVLTAYNMDINKLDKNQTLKALEEVLELESEEEFPVEIDSKYSYLLICELMDNLKEIDELISNNLVGYTIDRLSYVDRAIIRIAVLEMRFIGVPKNVAINEALEITKDYSNVDEDKQVKFNNKVLANIWEAIENGRK
jgi:N utilization substance protein B